MTSFFRLAASALAVGGVAVSAAAPAQAGTWSYDGHIQGYTVESLYDSGSYSGTDIINIFGPNGKETITVTCSPYEWASYGPNTKTWIDSIARSWCF